MIDSTLNANVNFKKSSLLKSFCEIELHWRVFRLIDISKETSHVFFSMLQIIASIDLFIKIFLYMFHTKSYFSKRVTNIKITLINDIYTMFSKNILRFLSLMWFVINMISYFSIIIESLKISINSWANVISFTN